MTQISDGEHTGTTSGTWSNGQTTPGSTPANGQAAYPYPGQAPFAQPQYWPSQPPAGWQPGMPYPYPVMQPYFVPVQPPAPPRTTNGTAIFALIVSLLWIGGIGSIIGLIFGIVGAKECDRTGQPGHGLATAAAILGFFGIILALVALGS